MVLAHMSTEEENLVLRTQDGLMIPIIKDTEEIRLKETKRLISQETNKLVIKTETNHITTVQITMETRRGGDIHQGHQLHLMETLALIT